MRQLADAERIWSFIRAIGAEADEETSLYFTGGATAVLFGWRETTIDVDIRFTPESDRLFRAIPRLKETLEINVELASPADFVPELPGWQGRSLFITRQGRVSFYHYDLYAQVLAKVERSHRQDVVDVQEMVARDLVHPARVREFFSLIESQLYRYPSVDPPSFRRALEDILGPDTKSAS